MKSRPRGPGILAGGLVVFREDRWEVGCVRESWGTCRVVWIAMVGSGDLLQG